MLVALVNWFATLILGARRPGWHNLLAAYVRYMTHLFGYLLLAANPYPPFTGSDPYPVDLEIDGPAPQKRLVTLFRLFLFLPGARVRGGVPGDVRRRLGLLLVRGASRTTPAPARARTVGILWTVAFFAWFAALVKGRMPLGFRNLQAYGLRYCAQAWAYVFLLMDRYPNLDPADPPSTGPLHPVGLAVTDDLRRSRLTVFFRLLLALPHFIWLLLWAIAAFLAVIANWFATLALGRSPRPLHRFLAAYIRYTIHVYSFVGLTANPFPGFTGTAGSYPVDPELPDPGRQRRLVTLFRLPLAIPAAAVSGGLYGLVFVAAVFGWFVGTRAGADAPLLPRGTGLCAALRRSGECVRRC